MTTIRRVRWRCRRGPRWPRRARFAVGGDAVRTSSTISSTHGRGGRRIRCGARRASPRRPAWPPTRSVRLRSSAAGGRWIGFAHLVFPRDWWTASAASTPSAGGRPKATECGSDRRGTVGSRPRHGRNCTGLHDRLAVSGYRHPVGAPAGGAAEIRGRRRSSFRRAGWNAPRGTAHGAAVLRSLRATAPRRLRRAFPGRLPTALARVGDARLRPARRR